MLVEVVVKNVLKCLKNKQVYSFNFGLDFGDGVIFVCLCFGFYVVVQIDDVVVWDWLQFEWNCDLMVLQYCDWEWVIEFNYMIFGIMEFGGDVV